MTTTFQSREAVRDELVTLFTNNGSWQEVYGYFPSVDEFSGKSPILIILSTGTQQQMSGVENNPASYRFTLMSYILAYSETTTWTSTLAEDTLDTMDKVTRQIVRNNAGSLTNADLLRFDNAFSQVENRIIEGKPYIVETRTLIADLHRGAV